MDYAYPKHIVVSAVNIRKGGTLTVLRDCLRYLSLQTDWQVTALVHDSELCRFPGITYMDIPWSTKSWFHRLWCEYVTMYRLSKKMKAVDLWFSLHDSTPRVQARRQAVYCHTSFPFLRPTWQDVRMDWKIPAFSRLTKYVYRMHVRRNNYLVVQADWMREGLACLTRFPKERIIVSPPAFAHPTVDDTSGDEAGPLFLYPSTPDCHKNFETLCEAACLLEQHMGKGRFCVVLTIKGDENRYACWLKDAFKDVSSIDFHGLMSREELFRYYGKACCLVFPSRVETWGLPISEFKVTGKPMILSDLPYARETATGARQVAFSPCRDARVWAALMEAVLKKNMEQFGNVPELAVENPAARDWLELFTLLTRS